jgi:hypothetical protein
MLNWWPYTEEEWEELNYPGRKKKETETEEGSDNK